jgi:hypothetical protein
VYILTHITFSVQLTRRPEGVFRRRRTPFDNLVASRSFPRFA